MKHILLIEDDAVLRENTAELLELSNYKLTTAANGKIGIEKAQQILPRESVARCAQKSAQTLVLEFRGISDKGDGIPKQRPSLILDLGELACGR